MMLAMEKLQIAKDVLESQLSHVISLLELNSDLERVKLTLRNGTHLYVQYKDAGEYSYSMIFSESHYDRIRFDNFDEDWSVNSSPNHLHPRNERVAKGSPHVAYGSIQKPVDTRAFPQIVQGFLTRPTVRKASV